MTDGEGKVDLAIGSQAGLAVLRNVEPTDVNCVVALEADLTRLAELRGHTVYETPPGGDVFLSIHWPRILSPRQLSQYRLAVNIHPGYLPIGRGMFPVFWAVYEGAVAGATTHVMTAQLDDGPIIFRETVPFTDDMTGGEVWQSVLDLEVDMAMRFLNLISSDTEIETFIPSEKSGPVRTRAEFESVCRGDGGLGEDPEQLQRLKRALTHPLYSLPTWLQDP